MAKNNNKIDIPDLQIQSSEAIESKVGKTKNKSAKGKANTGRRKFSLGKVFREMISELKKVDWAPFKRTKNNSGVLSQTATVLIVVLFFLVVISAFDLGLTKLLELLLESASPK